MIGWLSIGIVQLTVRGLRTQEGEAAAHFPQPIHLQCGIWKRWRRPHACISAWDYYSVYPIHFLQHFCAAHTSSRGTSWLSE